MNIGAKVKAARLKAGLTQEQLGKAAGVSKSAISQLEQGSIKMPAGDTLYAIAAALSEDAANLLESNASATSEPSATYEPMHVHAGPGLRSANQYIFVSKVRGARIQSGSGGVSWEHEEIARSHAFRKEWFEKKGLDPAHCRIFDNDGKSNEPWMMDGDAVLVSMGDRKMLASDDPTHNVFAIQYGEHSKFKRLVPQHDGSVVLRSYNPDKTAYPDERVAGDDLDSLAIIGRVVWRGG